MPDSLYQDMLRSGARARWVRLRTLTSLRWLAALGQLAAVLAARELVDVDLPLEICLLAIAASVIFNVVSIQIFSPTARLGERAATVSMLFDLAQVTLLLYLAGGLANPFAMLLLAPVTISASALALRSAIIVSVSALAFVTLLAFQSMPLRFTSGEVLAPPSIYVFGVWTALTISILFMTFYARRVTVETFRMTRALRVAEAALAREQRLTAIGGLAAAAAHELGTPLATIKLVSGELAEELKRNPELREDAELIHSQADRCRDILRDLSQGGRSDEHVKRAPIGAVIDEAAEPHRNRGVHIVTRFDGAPIGDAAEQPDVPRRPEIIHGLRNLIQNAVDFAESTIWIDVSLTGDAVRIVVGDDGPGYPEDLLRHLGDPFVRSRTRETRTSARASGSAREGEHTGMGLGLFIAKTLLERTGGRVTFATADRAVRRRNRGKPLEERAPSGALAVALWPAATLITAKDDARRPLGENPRFSIENV